MKAAEKRKMWASTWAAKAAERLHEQKLELQMQTKAIAKERKVMIQKHKRLKKKAAKMNLEELMDLCLYKATCIKKKEYSEAAASGTAACSSTDGWVPKNEHEAVDMIKAKMQGAKKTAIEQSSENAE